MSSSDDATVFWAAAPNSLEERALNELVQDLGHNVPETNALWATSLYLDLATDAAIEKFLKESGEYHGGMWRRVPESPKHKSELSGPLCDLVNSIIRHFRVSEANALREAINTHTTPFKREAVDAAYFSTLPDVAVKASGPSFSLPKGASLGFPNVSACFIVKLNAEPANVLDDLAQTAGFAKQMFVYQPNRLFFRSLVLTEHQARLFHFDRSGAQYTPPFNIHDKPHMFIRLILGLCATKEGILGLDDSIQWSTGPDGRKASGTLKTVGPDNSVVTYDLVMNESPFVRTCIRGRGTICWPVTNAHGDKFVVKEQWITGSRTPEFELLGDAKDLPGVCHMVSCEDNRSQTKEYRGNTELFDKDAFQNRRAVRIIMKAYGPSIEKFSSVEQVLATLRDAIAAHKALLSRNIVHRDISPNNVLQGAPGAEEGSRGVLVDLDMAFRRNKLAAQNRADFKIGTRMFQSLMVLRTWEMEQREISAHDYLDDLEAFFWLFSYLLLTYKADGKRAPANHMQKRVSSWLNGPTLAYAAKYTFLYSTRSAAETQRVMDGGWHYSCSGLFVEFRDYMGKLATEKEDLLFAELGEPEVAGELPDKFSTLLEHVDEHYDHILGLFDVALGRAKEDKKTAQTQDSAPSVPQVTPIPSDTPTRAPVAAKDVPTAPPLAVSPPSRSSQSTLTSPCETLKTSPLTHPSPSRSSKRRSEEAELDESPADVKRACPPSRRPLRAVIDPTLHVLSSVYQYCIKWL
ncbi:hypothetical protein EST38_g8801 [Candolleomyces aberdarensis]|uniref:Fungal-type protein kinase domain-containing protein n=1 Tax=Candolleomyces aberdarensis TaxID=2316362 RepID=A0A4Q2DDD5_9AGAR|nr:hypothetical protein EST38_g8801 [Candolleomyces aberdarensis]